VTTSRVTPSRSSGSTALEVVARLGVFYRFRDDTIAEVWSLIDTQPSLPCYALTEHIERTLVFAYVCACSATVSGSSFWVRGGCGFRK
jgi:hypothetical protein